MSRDTVGIPGYTEPPWLAAVRAQADVVHLLQAGERTLTLGQLTNRLTDAPPEAAVEFRGCGLDGRTPYGFCSWRGIYADLALRPDGGGVLIVRDLLSMCHEADGETFQGYKGGDYTMDANTPVWIDFYGDCHEWGLVDVRPLTRGGKIVKVLLVVRDWDAEATQ